VSTFKGIIHGGQVILPQPADLPDGTEVEIVPVDQAESSDNDRPMTPEEIARTLALMENVQPLEMTDQERALIEADRQERMEWEKARFFEHADRLREVWE
jgi:hypothetical protein